LTAACTIMCLWSLAIEHSVLKKDRLPRPLLK
jgi:hypothetical protein